MDQQADADNADGKSHRDDLYICVATSRTEISTLGENCMRNSLAYGVTLANFTHLINIELNFQGFLPTISLTLLQCLDELEETSPAELFTILIDLTGVDIGVVIHPT